MYDHKAQMLQERFIAGETVFCTQRGTLFHKNYFRDGIWKRALKQAGLSYRSFHNTRHTYATLSLGAGVPVNVVSAVLGHAKPSTTWDVYAHVLDGMQEKARDAIGAVLRVGGA